MYFHRGLPLALVREMETDQTPSMTVKVSGEEGKGGEVGVYFQVEGRGPMLEGVRTSEKMGPCGGSCDIT
jgi:hypothetical protein